MTTSDQPPQSLLDGKHEFHKVSWASTGVLLVEFNRHVYPLRPIRQSNVLFDLGQSYRTATSWGEPTRQARL